jgi:hypothetical protein
MLADVGDGGIQGLGFLAGHKVMGALLRECGSVPKPVKRVGGT